MYIDDPHCMKESAKALNILYVYDRSYEPYLIHWLFPIQMAFSDQAGEGTIAPLVLLSVKCFQFETPHYENVMSRFSRVSSIFH